MAKIKLNGDTSGYIEISAPAVSGNNTLELGPGTRILTNLDNTFTGVSTFSSDVYFGNDIYLKDGIGGYEKVEVGANDIRVESKHIHSQFGVWTRSNSLSDRRNGIDGDGSDLRLYANSAEKVRITSAGNIGIGTDTPYVNNSFTSLSIGGSGNYGLIELNKSDGVAGSWIDVYGTNGNGDLRITTAGTSGAITFWTGGTFTEKLRITSDGNVLVGDNNNTLSTASPVNFSLGGSFSNNSGQNPKLDIWENGAGGDYMSLGVSSNQMDFMMSRDDYDFVWYGRNDSNTGPEERMRLDNSEKLLDFAGTCKIRVKGSNNPGTTHAHLNIGSDGGASIVTRAIDIWGNWSNQESKAITWSHGTTSTSDMVCQQRVRYNTGPSSTVYEIGRFYNGQNTTAFPFQLQSTGTSTADLTIDGNVLHKTAAFVARSTLSQNITSTTRQKIDYTVDYSYQSVFSNSNDRFTCTKAGLYFFYARHWFGQNSNGTIYMDWLKNGSLVKEFRVTHPSSSAEYESIQGSGMIYMAVNDYLEVYGRSDGNGIFHESQGGAYSEFSGFYVSGG